MVTGKDGAIEALEWILPSGSFKFPRLGSVKGKS
jgi:hypothetical protein